MILDKTYDLYIFSFHVSCPRQRNDIDCGDFMLRLMKEILLLDRIEIPSDVWISNLGVILIFNTFFSYN